MKNLKFLFLSLLFVAFLAPNVNAKVETVNPDLCVIVLENGFVFATDAVVKITPSGQAQLKATFDVSDLVYLKTKGKFKKELVAVAVIINIYGLEYTLKEHVIVDSKGIATIVWNFNVKISVQ